MKKIFLNSLIIITVFSICISLNGCKKDTLPASNMTENPTPEPTPYVYEGELEEYTDWVEHVFFHPVIAYPKMAFDLDYMSKGFDDYFVTAQEFSRIIEQMYEKNYILVDINDVYEFDEEKGRYRQKTLMLPPGKIPFILSIDDLNYYEYMIANGTVHKLVLDENGEVAAYTVDPDTGEEQIRRDLAIVPLLDDFIKQHPDFSWKNAKGLIGVTGYEGILGYRTQSQMKNPENPSGDRIDNPNRASEIEAVKPVVQKLKDTGWTFASHSYGHYDAARISYDKLEYDTQKWINEVEYLIGKTPVYIYPYGSTVKVTDPKFDMFAEKGFKILCGVGNSAYYYYASNAVVTQRWHFDGISLRFQKDQLKKFFDASSVMDSSRLDVYNDPNFGKKK